MINRNLKLSQGELRILRLVAEEGLSTREIAARLKITVGSARHYCTSILQRTGARRLAQAIYFMTNTGMLKMTEEDSTVAKRLECIGCGQVTEITVGEERKLLEQLNPKMLAQGITLNCKCGNWQFVLQATVRKRR